jgi:hypothetical protein
MDTDIDMSTVSAKSSDVWVQPSFGKCTKHSIATQPADTDPTGYPWDEWEGTITILSTFVYANNELQSFSYVSLTDSIMYVLQEVARTIFTNVIIGTGRSQPIVRILGHMAPAVNL